MKHQGQHQGQPSPGETSLKPVWNQRPITQHFVCSQTQFSNVQLQNVTLASETATKCFPFSQLSKSTLGLVSVNKPHIYLITNLEIILKNHNRDNYFWSYSALCWLFFLSDYWKCKSAKCSFHTCMSTSDVMLYSFRSPCGDDDALCHVTLLFWSGFPCALLVHL